MQRKGLAILPAVDDSQEFRLRIEEGVIGDALEWIGQVSNRKLEVWLRERAVENGYNRANQGASEIRRLWIFASVNRVFLTNHILTVSLNALNRFDDRPRTNAVWSYPVTQVPFSIDAGVVPRRAVGMNALSVGSNDPISTFEEIPVSSDDSTERLDELTRVELVYRVRQRYNNLGLVDDGRIVLVRRHDISHNDGEGLQARLERRSIPPSNLNQQRCLGELVDEFLQIGQLTPQLSGTMRTLSRVWATCEIEEIILIRAVHEMTCKHPSP